MYRKLIVASLGWISLFGASTAHSENDWPAQVGTVAMGAGTLFVDDRGHTLYTYKRDRATPGASSCTGACETNWPPLIVSEEESLQGPWSRVRRHNGSYQLAYQGRPVYRHRYDGYPGAIVGEKASNQWDVLFEPIDTPADLAIRATVDGQILVDSAGRPVYSNTQPDCDSGCSEGWRPLEAPWLARSLGTDWRVVTTPEGTGQWAYREQPLFVAEAAAAAPAEGWKQVVLQPRPPLPEWVSFQETDLGPVLTNENGMTLYSVASDPKVIARTTCDAECARTHWTPVVAAPEATPLGNWSPEVAEDGSRYWTYLGRRVYTFNNDRTPGDTKGDKFATGVGIRGGWRAILKETLVQRLF